MLRAAVLWGSVLQVGKRNLSNFSLQPDKAYKNQGFLNSPAARHIRILCEYEETRQRFLRAGVRDTVVFFGSARARSTEDAALELAAARATAKASPDDPDVQDALRRAEAGERLAPYYDAARELGRKVAAWSEERGHHGKRRYCVTSGGGPGIMEAANRGASEAGAITAGLGISLPFEQGVNPYVSPELAFEFHYFFTRKYWFLYLCDGLVIFPGGFGTMDELFETLTLVQTGKIKRRLPVVLFGSEYWNKVIHLDAMVEFGTISPRDVDLVHISDDVDEAYAWLVGRLDEHERHRK